MVIGNYAHELLPIILINLRLISGSLTHIGISLPFGFHNYFLWRKQL
ncbi:hypothetical protein NIES3585_41470 [Nodularia sp. NIES-3585]|nr:hypothetical protein NIES3585_41470 [Nodularia sp. NIES-3585]